MLAIFTNGLLFLIAYSEFEGKLQNFKFRIIIITNVNYRAEGLSSN